MSLSQRDYSELIPRLTDHIIHICTSDTQLEVVISQDESHWHSNRNAQRNYASTEQELMSIMDTLKEFRNILPGQIIILHTDHKNLVHESYPQIISQGGVLETTHRKSLALIFDSSDEEIFPI